MAEIDTSVELLDVELVEELLLAVIVLLLAALDLIAAADEYRLP